MDFAACQDNSQKFRKQNFHQTTHFFYSLQVLDIQYFVIVVIHSNVSATNWICSLFVSISFVFCVPWLVYANRIYRMKCAKMIESKNSHRVNGGTRNTQKVCTMQMSTKALTAFKMRSLFVLFSLFFSFWIKKNPMYSFKYYMFSVKFHKKTNKSPSVTLYGQFSFPENVKTLKEIWKKNLNEAAEKNKNENKAAPKWQNKNENRI